MQKDLSKDKRFIADTPKDFSLGEARLSKDGTDKSSSKRTSEKQTTDKTKPVALSSNVQKALFVVDDIRARTLNTLDVLKNLSKDDNLKLRVLEQKLNELRGVSDKILDESGSSTERDAESYISTLDDVKVLLKKYKDVEVQGQSFEKFLEKTQLESQKRILLEATIAKVLADAGKNLGTPFSSFLKQNIKEVSSSPIRRDTSNVLMSLAGPLAPLLAFTRDFLPEAIDEFDRIKEGLKSLKKDPKEKNAPEVLSKDLNVNKADLTSLDTDNSSDPNLSAVAKNTEELVQKEEQYRAKEVKSDLESTKFKTKVLKHLKSITEAEEDQSKGDNKKGLLSTLSSLAGGLGTVGKMLFKIGPIATIATGLTKLLTTIGPAIGTGLVAVLSNPATWAVAAVALTGALAFKFGQSLRDEFHKKEEDQKEGFEKITQPLGFKLDPMREQEAFGKQITSKEDILSKEKSFLGKDLGNREVKPMDELTSDPISRSDTKTNISTAFTKSKDIKINKIIPRPEKPFDVQELIAGVSEAMHGALTKTNKPELQSKYSKSDSLPSMARDHGLLLINFGAN